MSASSQVARSCTLSPSDGLIAIVLQELFDISITQYEFMIYKDRNVLNRYGISSAHVCLGEWPILQALEANDILKASRADGGWRLTPWGHFVLDMAPFAIKNMHVLRKTGSNLLRFPPRREIPLDTIR